MLSQPYLIRKSCDEYADESLKGDLQDIAGHYKLGEVVDAKGNKDYVPTGCSGFWVVEAIKDGQESSEVVGCVGLDAHEEEKIGEIRRLAVSPSCRRKGIAGMLLRALEDHAYKHGVASLYLTNTIYQPAARHLYEKYGWFVKERRFVGSKWGQVQLIELRKHFDRRD